MIDMQSEPRIKVGLINGVQSVRLELQGAFKIEGGETLQSGMYLASLHENGIVLEGETSYTGATVQLDPVDFETCSITVHDVVIGINFHWERKETQVFQGSLKIIAYAGGLTIINELPLESYLVSVISSEMSATCPPELLCAHAIVSRSWLLAQLVNAKLIQEQKRAILIGAQTNRLDEIIKWYDRENHASFDVCADDHCQRYQGISKAFSPAAFAAIEATRGKVLIYAEEICDARYSKSCGGKSEVYAAAWEDRDVPYLSAVYDWIDESEHFAMPLTEEANAESWITASPLAYCNTKSKELLSRILPGFDQETLDFYRWRVRYTQAELQEVLRTRTGIDFGAILSMEAIERGESARIIRLRITGTKRTVIIGKELEIRRALSRSHLYSSAFVVWAEKAIETEYPETFELIGAGWGHGVGLCQIGAAVMADKGFKHEQILSHYFTGAELQKLY